MTAVNEGNPKIKGRKLENDEREETNESHQNYRATIDSMPIELLTQIIGSLPPVERIRLERVCRRWQSVSRNAWRDVKRLYIIHPDDPSYYYKFRGYVKKKDLIVAEKEKLYIGTDSSRLIKSIASRLGPNMKSLTFTHYRSLKTQRILSIITKYCRNIEVLDLALIEISNSKVLLNLFEANEKLDSFRCRYSINCIKMLPLKDWKSLRLMVDYQYEHCEEKIIQLIKNSKSLEEFETDDWSSGIMQAILEHEHLKSIHFTSKPDDPTLKYNITKFKDLTSLEITFEQFNRHEIINFIDDLSRNCRNLKKLVITAATLLKAALRKILNFQHLETLELHCGGITDKVLSKLIVYKNLTIHFFINECTDNGFLEMIKKSQQLEKLNIVRTSVTSRMFTRLVNDISDRSKFLEVMVPYNIYDEVSEICEGSKVIVVKNLNFQHQH